MKMNIIYILKSMKKHEYLLLAFAILFVTMMSNVTADVSSLGTIKQSECIEIPQVCASCSYVNLSVQYPNKSIAVSNQPMVSQGAGLWTYNFCNTSQLGRYDVSGQGDLNGIDTGFSVLWFEVSVNGKEPAEGIIIVVFSLIFIAIISFGIIYFLKSLAHVIQLEMDLIDASIMISTYLAMWMFYYISFEYLGNALINDLLEIAISVGAVTHVFLPLVGFLVSFIMTNLKFKQKARVTY
jgi:hypothetical protein